MVEQDRPICKKSMQDLTNDDFLCIFWRKNKESSSLWKNHIITYNLNLNTVRGHVRLHSNTIKCMTVNLEQIVYINIFKQTLVFLICFTRMEVLMAMMCCLFLSFCKLCLGKQYSFELDYGGIICKGCVFLQLGSNSQFSTEDNVFFEEKWTIY